MPDRPNEPPPLISEDRIRAALTALGLRDVHSADPGRPVDRDVLAGALLALADMTTSRADPDKLAAGYRAALAMLTDGDEPAAARWWARLSSDRLHLAVDGLPRPAHGDLPLANVIGPAATAAANVLVLLHNTAPDPGLVNTVVTTAGLNLDHAAEGFVVLRERLKGAGYDL